MNFFKIIIISVFFMLLSKVSMADSHDKEQNIIDKAKEIWGNSFTYTLVDSNDIC
mgnify:CR=1 FL=1